MTTEHEPAEGRIRIFDSSDAMRSGDKTGGCGSSKSSAAVMKKGVLVSRTPFIFAKKSDLLPVKRNNYSHIGYNQVSHNGVYHRRFSNPIGECHGT